MRHKALKANTVLMPLEDPEFLLLLTEVGVELGVEEVPVEMGIDELKVTPCAE